MGHGAEEDYVRVDGSSGVVIKRSTLDDLPFILEQLKEFSDFFASKYPLFPTCKETAFRIVQKMMGNHLFFTSFNRGERSGFIAGWVGIHPFNPEIICLTEAFWWVTEKHRMSRAGSLLLEEFVGWGKRNAQWVSMTLEDKSPVSSGPLLKRGFRLKETSYLLECD